MAIRVPLVPRQELEPTSVLRVSADMAVGSIGLREGAYELNHVVDLSCTTWESLDGILGYLGQLGAVMRSHVAAPKSVADSGECFAHYQT